MEKLRDSVPPLWIRTVEAIALLKVALSAPGFAADREALPLYTALIYLAHVLAFSSAGLFLRIAGRGDRRAVSLGLFLLVVGTAWTDRALAVLVASRSFLDSPATALLHLQVASFAPFFFWHFIRDFPRRQADWWTPFVRLGTHASLGVGIALFAANMLLLFPDRVSVLSVLQWFDRGSLDSVYWPMLLVVLLPAIPYAAWKGRNAAADEKRRVQIVLLGLMIGLTPEIVLTLLSGASEAVDAFVSTPTGSIITDIIVYPPELSIPFITIYAVLAHRALNVRLIVRRVLHYALARYSIVGMIALPFLGLLMLMYRGRNVPLAELWLGPQGMLAALSIGGGILLLQARPRLLTALDRRFFREQYDARQILSNLVERTRRVDSRQELATTLSREVDRALHVHSAHALWIDAATGALESPLATLPSLSLASPIVRRLEESDRAVMVDWERRAPWLDRLPEPDRRWLTDADAHLLVPVAARDGSLLGVLALGEKLSGLPFTGEDLLLLRTIANSAALAVEGRLPSSSRLSSAGVSDQPARECIGCGAVAKPDVRRCRECGQSTVAATVPLVLAGKFRLLQRVGSGGMGVVYCGEDLALGRRVAIKSLPHMAADGVRRLRGEARAMASVSHPGLALIYGAESWRGVPMLVMEFLPGGTLADRLQVAHPRVEEVLDLGLRLVPALASLHESGILHGDIKPSNIGFAGAGVPKLLDFGLARVIEAARARDEEDREPGKWSAVQESAGAAGRGTSASGLIGTPLYLAPEAVRGERPEVGFDLWAFCMVLYEMIAGRHPFDDGTLDSVYRRIAAADLPDVREFAPWTPAAVAEFLLGALAPEQRRRPASAQELHERLKSLSRDDSR